MAEDNPYLQWAGTSSSEDDNPYSQYVSGTTSESDDTTADIDPFKELTHRVDLVTRGVANGIAAGASFPADVGVYAANELSNLAGHPLNLKMPSQDFNEKLTGLGISEPKNIGERYFVTGVGALTGGGLGNAIVPALKGAVAGQTLGEMGAPFPVQLGGGILAGGLSIPKKPAFKPISGTLKPGQLPEDLSPLDLKAKKKASDIVLRSFKADGITPKDIGDALSENLPSGKPFIGLDFAHLEDNNGIITQGPNSREIGKLAPRMSVEGRKIASDTAKRTNALVQADRINRLLENTFSKRGYYDIKDSVLDSIAKNTPEAYEKAFEGGSTAPLEKTFTNLWGEAGAQRAEAVKALRDVERRMTLLQARKTMSGDNVYALHEHLANEKTLQADIDAHNDAIATIDAKKLAYQDLMRRAQEDGTANAPGAVWSPLIQEFLDHPDMKPGLNLGLKIAKRDVVGTGKKYNPVEYAEVGIDEAGDPIIGTVPTMRLLDAAKKGLDTQIKAEYDPMTRKYTENGKSLIAFKNRFVAEMDDINPKYKEARKTFSDPMGIQTSLDEGRNYKSYDPEEIEQMFSGDPDATQKYGIRVLGTTAEKQAFLVGVKRAIMDTMINAKDPTMALNKAVGSEKLRPMFPSETAYNDFVAQLEDANRMKNTDILSRSEQSMTDPSRNLREELQETPFSDYLNVVRSSLLSPKRLARMTAGTALDRRLRQDMIAGGDKAAGEITKLLHSSDPQTFYDLQALMDEQGMKAPGIFSGIKDATKEKLKSSTIPSAVGVEAGAMSQPPPLLPEDMVPPPQQPQDDQRSELSHPAYSDVPEEHAAAANDLKNRIYRAETGSNPNQANRHSSASGPGQFINSTWRSLVYKYGREAGVTLKDKNSVWAQDRMMPFLMKENAQILTKKLGGAPTDADMYAAHVFGPTRAATLIQAANSDKDPVATTLVPKEVVDANKGLFFDKGVPRRASELYALLDKKVSPDVV